MLKVLHAGPPDASVKGLACLSLPTPKTFSRNIVTSVTVARWYEVFPLHMQERTFGSIPIGCLFDEGEN